MPGKTLDELEQEEKRWPYSARRIRTHETEMMRLLLAGLRDKHRFPFVIVTDLDLIRQGGQGRIIRPVDDWRFYPEFCRYLQQDVPGGHQFCERSTVDNVKKCLGGPSCLSRLDCRMGLHNLYLPLAFEDQPVAYCAAGKFRFAEDEDVITQCLEKQAKTFLGLSIHHLEQLEERICTIPVKESHNIGDLEDRLVDGMEFLKKLLGDNYEKNRRFYYRNFRGRIEDTLYRILQKLDHATDIAMSQEVNEIIQKICKYLGTRYLAIFFSDTPESTGLELLVQHGLGTLQRTEVLFNWKKGKVLKEDLGIGWDFATKADDLRKGVRGIKSHLVANFAFAFPFELAAHYGIVALGPFNPEVSVAKEKELLNRLCYAIGLRIGSLAVLGTMVKKEAEKIRAVAIPAHTVKHGLANVRSVFILIRKLQERKELSQAAIQQAIDKAIERGETSIEVLASFATTTLESPDAMQGLSPEIQKSHLQFEKVSPIVPIEQCVAVYLERARDEGKDIEIDELSLENLPGISADPSILKLAIGILLENAIKYTGKGKYISIRGQWVKGTERVDILVRNVGLEIGQDEYDSIFEMGYRGRAPRAHLLQQKGYGIGLGQVKKIIKMHDGDIFVECVKRGEGAWDHLVTFTIVLRTELGRTLGI